MRGKTAAALPCVLVLAVRAAFSAPSPSPMAPSPSPMAPSPVPRGSPSPSPQASPAPPAASPASPEAASPGPSASAKADESEDLVASTIALDVSTAGIFDLASWCRSLGLAETGTVDELRTRLYGHYGVKPPEGKKKSGRTITVKNTGKNEGKAERFTMEGVEESYVRFSGGVNLVLSDPDKGWTHDITANEIVLNETASLLSARGDVVYILKKPSQEERFVGESLDVDLDTWTGHFLDGRIVRTGGTETLQTKFVFAADVVKTGEAERAVFDNAVISSSESERPYYSIRATRVWLLGSGEWAMSNAVLSVGEVPLLYLPFFFYNSEELVFHPVIGDRDRQGPFFQTTIYLAGQKPASTESISLLQLQAAKSSGPKRVKGLYLVSADKSGEGQGDKKSGNVFKVMLDAYSNLGAFIGGEFHSADDPRLKIDVLALAAITRNVYSSTVSGLSLDYTPFIESHGWQSVWNESRFLGSRLPLRYGADISLTANVRPLAASIIFPLFSDPYVEYEFKDRKEDQDWFGFLKEAKTDASVVNKRNALDMKAEAALTPSMAKISPYVSTASIPYLRTKLSWLSKTSADDGRDPASAIEAVDPTRDFYYPDLWTMADSSAKISGTLFSWPPKAAAASPVAKPAAAPDASKKAAKPEVPAIEDPDADPAAKASPDIEPRKPWEEKPEGEEEKEVKSATAGDADFPLSLFRLDVMKSPQAAPPPQAAQPFSFSLGYAFEPSATLERRFLAQAWPNPEDIDWSSLHDKSLVKLSGSIDAQARILGDIATLSTKLSMKTQDQDHFNIIDDVAYLTPAAILALEKTDAQARSSNVTGSFKATAKPFGGNLFWGESSLSYDLGALLYDFRYESMAAEGPVYATKTLEWTIDSIPTHALTATVVALPFGWRQSLQVSASLPPKDQSYAASLSGKIDALTLSASTKMFLEPEGTAWQYDPLTIGAQFAPGGGLAVSDTYIQNLEGEYPESNVTSLSWKGLAASFTMRRSKGYFFDSASTPMQWRETAEDAFLRPTDLSLSYARPDLAGIRAWKDRITVKPTVSTNLAFNFLQFTKSNFNLNVGAKASINRFLDLTFNSSSQNSSIFWYFVGLPGFDMGPEINALRKDLFRDLIDSFTFFAWNSATGAFEFTETYRRSSLFKLKTIGLSLVHHMDDWDLSLDLSGKPVLKTVEGIQNYVFTPEFSISVAWKPIPELKTKTRVYGSGETQTITIE
jgi:hypothetical protein